jgi:hypothetical protein
MKRILIALFTILLTSSLVNAQIATDRPSVTASPEVIPKSAVQLEMGYVDFGSIDNRYCVGQVSEKYRTINSGLMRFGISKQFELRMVWNYSSTYIENTSLLNARPPCKKNPFPGGDTTIRYQGLQPISFGFKYQLFNSDRFKLGLLGSFRMPFGAHSQYEIPNLGTEIYLPLSIIVSPKITVSPQISAAWSRDNTEPILGYSTMISYSITPKISSYIEPFGLMTMDEQAQLVNYINLGFAYLPHPNFQVDLAMGNGSGWASNYFITLGISALFTSTKIK